MTDKASLSLKAATLRQLHRGPSTLILLNVWDVAGACLVQALGFPAVATSSWAIASSLGFHDGQRISRQQMLDVVARIASAVEIPVSADMEGGYAQTPDEMVKTARELIAAGAVGLNLEDGEADRTRLVPLERQLAKIKALRATANSAGIPLVLNARTDALWWKGAKPKTSWDDAVRRANAYRKAGADCVFALGLRNSDDIQRFMRESPGPLNVLAGPGIPPIQELQRYGVARVSLGAGPYRAALGLLKKAAAELRGSGTYASIVENAIPPDEVNRWFV
jgi:2-methylisocitrate lyase-like PEP mutase family enzyme